MSGCDRRRERRRPTPGPSVFSRADRTWQLEPLDVHRPGVAPLADPLRRRARPSASRSPSPSRVPICPACEARLRRRPSAGSRPPARPDRLRAPALHRPGDRAPGGDGVHPELVAERRGAQHVVRVAHPQGAKGEEGLVLQPRRGLRAIIPGAVVMLAANGAGGTGMLASVVLQAQRLAGDRLRLVEVTAGEVASGQRPMRLKKATLATVPISRYLAVAGPTLRAARSRASVATRRGSAACGSRCRAPRSPSAASRPSRRRRRYAPLAGHRWRSPRSGPRAHRRCRSPPPGTRSRAPREGGPPSHLETTPVACQQGAGASCRPRRRARSTLERSP